MSPLALLKAWASLFYGDEKDSMMAVITAPGLLIAMPFYTIGWLYWTVNSRIHRALQPKGADHG